MVAAACVPGDALELRAPAVARVLRESIPHPPELRHVNSVAAISYLTVSPLGIRATASPGLLACLPPCALARDPYSYPGSYILLPASPGVSDLLKQNPGRIWVFFIFHLCLFAWHRESDSRQSSHLLAHSPAGHITQLGSMRARSRGSV